jgi:hypothetical protein
MFCHPSVLLRQQDAGGTSSAPATVARFVSGPIVWGGVNCHEIFIGFRIVVAQPYSVIWGNPRTAFEPLRDVRRHVYRTVRVDTPANALLSGQRNTLRVHASPFGWWFGCVKSRGFPAPVGTPLAVARSTYGIRRTWLSGRVHDCPGSAPQCGQRTFSVPVSVYASPPRAVELCRSRRTQKRTCGNWDFLS